jgi:hypothetical protein
LDKFWSIGGAMRVQRNCLIIGAFLFSFSTAAADTKDQWICVAEAAATLTEPSPDESGRWKAEAYGHVPDQYLVSEDGVKRVGEDGFIVEPCELTENGAPGKDKYVNCPAALKNATWWFTKGAQNYFRLYYFAAAYPVTYAFVAGKCTKL